MAAAAIPLVVENTVTKVSRAHGCVRAPGPDSQPRCRSPVGRCGTPGGNDLLALAEVGAVIGHGAVPVIDLALHQHCVAHGPMLSCFE